MNPAALAGALTLRPGRGLSVIDNSRAPLAGVLLRGRPAHEAALLLPRLYALCGQAHRVAAGLAVTAAGGEAAPAEQTAQSAPATPVAPAEHELIITETLREHVRRLLIDWPRLLGLPDDGAAAALRACPLFGAPAMAHNGEARAALRDWIALELLGEPAATWLARWRDDGAACLRHWSRRSRLLPARLMRAVEDDARALVTHCPPLRAHAEADGMRALAAALAADPAFERAPTVAGAPRETGCWTRLGGMGGMDGVGGPAPADAWLRMGARLAELCALAEGHDEDEDGARLGAWGGGGSQSEGTGAGGVRLARGAVALGPGQAIAWTEMARGLLCHWVRLDLDGGRPVIADYRVVAPTEWNFHPRGPVAQALAAMPAGGGPEQRAATARRIGVLAAAFDPCVAIEIEFEHA